MTEVVIFCGGKGTRLWPYTESINKNMVDIGGRPMLWHVMKIYSSFGFKDFILCLGLHGGKVWEYFSKSENVEPDWKINFVNTGEETLIGGRLKRVKDFIKGEDFFATYGDGISDIDVRNLMEFHKKHGKIGTLTAVKPFSQFGILDIDHASENATVLSFKEKPVLDSWINGGFFVFNRKIFYYLEQSEDLENVVLKKLAEDRQLSAYKHEGFWKCMDTFKDANQLNELWDSGAPWAVWNKAS